MVRVGLDATPLLGDRTGIGVAVEGMMRALGGRPGLDLVGYGLTGTGWRRLPSALPASVRPARRVPLPASPLLRMWARSNLPPIEWVTGRLDVVHGTNFVVPPARRARRVVSVWDLTAVRYPQLCTPSSRRYPELVRRAVADGAVVHTPSRFVAGEIMDHFGAAVDQVRVIPPGVEVEPGRLPPPVGGQPYVLGLGTVEPRKDFPVLVAAFDQIAAGHPELALCIAGPKGWGEDALGAAIAGARHRDRIRRLGWVPEVGPLVAGAAVFAFPSRYEGFGFPPLEAMAHGVPVVATATSSLPEVLDEAADMVPVADAHALAAALDRVLRDRGHRDHLVAAGRRQAARYSWATTGDALAALYAEMGEGP